MNLLGIDIGSATLKVVVLAQDHRLLYQNEKKHHGNSMAVLNRVLQEIRDQYQITHGMITGNIDALGEVVNFKIESVPASITGLQFLYPSFSGSIIDIGAENAKYITGLSAPTSLPEFSMNASCAGGTGSFFEDQMGRLGLEIENYSNLVADATEIPRISGRCSVFAKTDIIHLQQEGKPLADILLGLCYATMKNFKAVTMKNLPIEKPIALTSNVYKNQGVLRALYDVLELSEEELLVDPNLVYAQALGAALQAQEASDAFDFDAFCKIVERKSKELPGLCSAPKLRPLKRSAATIIKDPELKPLTGPTHCALGIDVGSTSTNLVLTDDTGALIDFQYLRTKGDPENAVTTGLAAIQEKYQDQVIIDCIGVTGSGRYFIGKKLGTDIIYDEITAQAYAAKSVCPEVDTVFEIGGQDSKYISLQEGKVSDFQMNKICAAGTGSFIEEQALRLGYPIEDYAAAAFLSENPADLGERCTVFMENNIAILLNKGVPKTDIAAGICYSVIHNYLHKVVANKAVGSKIVLQGGVVYNEALVAAFQSVYGDRIIISPYFAVSGAYGVSLLAREHLQKEQHAPLLPYNKERNIDFYKESRALLLEGYHGEIDPAKETIGVPYALMIHKFFPMVHAFFKALGYNVLLSPETDEDIIALAQKYAQAETCYPVKLIYGHMAYLAEKKVDYIFLPSVHTMKHEKSQVYHNYGCVFMQTAPQMVFNSMPCMKTEDKNIQLLNPVFSLDFGQQAMVSAMIDIGVSLGKNKAVCGKVLISGAMAVRKHSAALEKKGAALLDSIGSDEKVLVLITRTYGIEDPILNMGIPEILLEKGYKVLTLSHLPAHDLDLTDEYPDLYWPFGQHIISGAKMVKNHPNLYAVYLTNHGCGPDTMLSHLFKKEMGDKPYLSIEVDEHFSKVGVITRIEAFLNSLNFYESKDVGSLQSFLSPPMVKQEKTLLSKDTTLYLPPLYPYSQLAAATLNKKGYSAQVLPATDTRSITLGNQHIRSKEYMSFTTNLGDILKQAEKDQQGGHFFLPLTEGAEADGVYSEVISNILRESPYSQHRLVSPMLETLFIHNEHLDEIFSGLLAGDLILAAKEEDRAQLIDSLLEKDLSFDSLLQAAQKIIDNGKTALYLIGEPICIYNDYLNRPIKKEIQKSNYRILSMPLAEYMLFLWQDRCEKKDDQKKLDKLLQRMSKLHYALADASPYAASLAQLTSIANQELPNYSGANGRYRLAKSLDLMDQGQACIELASMYENTQTILSVLTEKKSGRKISLEIDNTFHENQYQLLKSFLFYGQGKR